LNLSLQEWEEEEEEEADEKEEEDEEEEDEEEDIVITPWGKKDSAKLLFIRKKHGFSFDHIRSKYFKDKGVTSAGLTNRFRRLKAQQDHYQMYSGDAKSSKFSTIHRYYSDFLRTEKKKEESSDEEEESSDEEEESSEEESEEEEETSEEDEEESEDDLEIVQSKPTKRKRA